MTASLDRSAYEDCFDIFDRALVSDRGVRVKFLKYGDGFNYRLRMNRARQLDREISKRIHADNVNHHEYGISKYSAFTIKLDYDHDRGWWWMILKRNTIDGMLIEDLPPDDDEMSLADVVEAETGLDISEVEEIPDDEREGAS